MCLIGVGAWKLGSKSVPDVSDLSAPVATHRIAQDAPVDATAAVPLQSPTNSVVASIAAHPGTQPLANSAAAPANVPEIALGSPILRRLGSAHVIESRTAPKNAKGEVVAEHLVETTGKYSRVVLTVR
jgi:hypothetical protein